MKSEGSILVRASLSDGRKRKKEKGKRKKMQPQLNILQTNNNFCINIFHAMCLSSYPKSGGYCTSPSNKSIQAVMVVMSQKGQRGDN